MTYQRMKVVAALENAELEGAGVAEELVPASAPEVEAGAAEIDSAVVAADDQIATVDDAAGEIVALTDVQDQMQAAVDSGEGLSEQTAQMAEIAVERIKEKLGFRRDQPALPGLESFGNSGTRLTATKMGLESVMDTLKKGGQAVLAFLKQIWESLKSFFAGLIKSRAALGKNLASAQKRANEIKAAGHKKKDETIKSGAAKALSIDGKADAGTAAKVLADSAKLANVGQSISTVLSNAARNFDAFKEGQLSAMTDGIEKALGGLTSVTGKGEGKSFHGNLVGGKSIAFTKTSGSDKNKVGLSVEQVGKAAEAATALEIGDVIQLLSEADAALKQLNSYDKVDKELAAVVKSAIDYLNKMGNLNTAAAKGDKEGEAAGKDVNKLVADMREVANAAQKVGLHFPALQFNAVKAAVDYANASMNNMAGEEKKPKEGEGDKK